MGERQNTQTTKQKQIPENRKHAHRSQRLLMLQAHELDSTDTELNDGMDEKLDEGKYNDLADGRYEKTIFVKTWTGKTIKVEIDLKHTVETVKGQIEAKTRILKDHQNLESTGKVLMEKNAEGLQHDWRRDYRNDDVPNRRNKAQKSQPNSNGSRKRQKSENNPNHTLMSVDWKKKNLNQPHQKKKQLQRKSV